MFKKIKEAIQKRNRRGYSQVVVPVEIHIITKGWRFSADGTLIVINNAFPIDIKLSDERYKELISISQHPDDYYDPDTNPEVMFIGVGLGTRLNEIHDFKITGR